MNIDTLIDELNELIHHSNRQIERARRCCDGYNMIVYKAKVDTYRDLLASIARAEGMKYCPVDEKYVRDCFNENCEVGEGCGFYV